MSHIARKHVILFNGEELDPLANPHGFAAKRIQFFAVYREDIVYCRLDQAQPDRDNKGRSVSSLFSQSVRHLSPCHKVIIVMTM